MLKRAQLAELEAVAPLAPHQTTYSFQAILTIHGADLGCLLLHLLLQPIVFHYQSNSNTLALHLTFLRQLQCVMQVHALLGCGDDPMVLVPTKTNSPNTWD